jgi:hypothetical protein
MQPTKEEDKHKDSVIWQAAMEEEARPKSAHTYLITRE